MTYAPPGSFGLSIIAGKTGKLVNIGQAIAGDKSVYTHAFMVLDKGQIMEAMPEGARIYPLQKRADDPGGIVISDAPIKNYVRSAPPSLYLEQDLRRTIVRVARELEGTKYNFADYLYLGLATLGFKAHWLRKRIASSDHMICSQLVDEVYRRVGIHLFDDDRLPMDVTPGDLDRYRRANL